MKPYLYSVVLLFAMAWSNIAFCGEIHDAAKAGDLEKVKALLIANPDLVSSRDENGATALHGAALNGSKDVAEYLLANNADVNAKNNYGMTPLHVSVIFHHKDVASALVFHKADASIKDNDGDTAFTLAETDAFAEPAEASQSRNDDMVTAPITASTKTMPKELLEEPFGDPVIVKGIGFEIKRSELDQVVTSVKASASAAGKPFPPDLEVGILNQLITIQLLCVTATDEDRATGKIDADAQYLNLRKRFGSEEAFQRQLKTVGLTADELRAKATQEATAKVVLRRLLNADITDEQAKEYYAEHPQEFTNRDGTRMTYATISNDLKGILKRRKITKDAPTFVKNLQAAAHLEILDPALREARDRVNTVSVVSNQNEPQSGPNEPGFYDRNKREIDHAIIGVGAAAATAFVEQWIQSSFRDQ